MIILKAGMKRLIAFIMCILVFPVLSACGSSPSAQAPNAADGNMPSAADSLTVADEKENDEEVPVIQNESVKLAQELKMRSLDGGIHEEYIPYIKFYPDMHCELLVNMMEWVAEIEAAYTVYLCDDEKLMVACDLGTTEFASSLHWGVPVFYLVQSDDNCWIYMGGENIGAMLPESEFYADDPSAAIEVDCTRIHTLADQDVYRLLMDYYQDEGSPDSNWVLEGASDSDGIYFTQVRCGVPGASADTSPFSSQPLCEVSVDKSTNLVVETHMITHEVRYFILSDPAAGQKDNSFSPDGKQFQEFPAVVDRYFEIIKSILDDESLSIESLTESLKQEFPHYLGDDLIDIFCSKNMDASFDYEIAAANIYSMEQPDNRRMWEIADEEEFLCGFTPDAYAEVSVKLTFNPQGEKNAATAFSDFLLVQCNGGWGLFYIDDALDEPNMLFPF